MLVQDSSKASAGFQPVPEGEYEVFAEKAVLETAKTKGTPYTNFTFVIRGDVDQEAQGRKLFHKFFHTENTKSRWFAFNRDLGIPDGAEFQDYEDWSQYVLGKPIRVVVKHRKGDDGKTRAEISEFKPSEYRVMRHSSPEPTLNVTDDALPF